MKWIKKNWQIYIIIFFVLTTIFFFWRSWQFVHINYDQKKELEFVYGQLLKEKIRMPAVEDCEYICETEFCPECENETIYLEDLGDN